MNWYASNVSTRKTWGTNTATPVVHFESWLNLVDFLSMSAVSCMDMEKNHRKVWNLTGRVPWYPDRCGGRCFPTWRSKAIYPVYICKNNGTVYDDMGENTLLFLMVLFAWYLRNLRITFYFFPPWRLMVLWICKKICIYFCFFIYHNVSKEAMIFHWKIINLSP